MNRKLLYTLALLFAVLQTFAQTYTYDNLNRLTKVVYSNGTTITYTFDALGNRTSKKVTGAINSASGDVNNDGVVDISDVVLTVNFILGGTPAVFNQDAADINKDGNIDISDVVAIVNMILNGTGTGMGDTPRLTSPAPMTTTRTSST